MCQAPGWAHREMETLPAKGSQLSFQSVGLSDQVAWDYILALLLTGLDTISTRLDLLVFHFLAHKQRI